MKLYINTAGHETITVSLVQGKKEIISETVAAQHAQAEKLLPLVQTILSKNKLKLSDIKQIEVENKGEGFTSLRIGVATANILGYALNIPVAAPGRKAGKLVVPVYSKPPTTTKKKRG